MVLLQISSKFSKGKNAYLYFCDLPYYTLMTGDRDRLGYPMFSDSMLKEKKIKKQFSRTR
jgi:hypothetical protein